MANDTTSMDTSADDNNSLVDEVSSKHGVPSSKNELVGQEPTIKIDYEPKENSIDISKTGDKKLWKEIITEGEGDETPGESMEVFVHYTGRLANGTVFDSSVKRGTPFSFNLGSGSVIQGWDIGVATMKKNEKCILICHPDYAYGSRAQGDIPPNSTLYFEVELLSWEEEDLTSKKTGGIRRRKLVSGTSKYMCPNEGAVVEIHLEGYYNGKIFQERDVKFNLGEGRSKQYVIPYGVEKALYKFTEKEKSRLTLQPKYAFGEVGNAELGIPPNAVVNYIVELKSFSKAREAWELNGQEKLEHSREFKRKGTEYFTEEQYRLAAEQYKKIVNFLKAESMLQGAEEDERKSLLCVSHLNQAICYLKLQDHFEAKKAAEEALVLEPRNIKGLFRLGLANVGINEPEEAKANFQKVLEEDPKNKLAIQQIALCNQKIKVQRDKEKQIYGKMFEKFAKTDDQKELVAKSKQPNGLDNLDEWKKSADVPADTKQADSDK